MFDTQNPNLSEDERELYRLLNQYEEKQKLYNSIYIPSGELLTHRSRLNYLREEVSPDTDDWTKRVAEAEKLVADEELQVKTKTAERAPVEAEFKAAETELRTFFDSHPDFEYAWLTARYEKHKNDKKIDRDWDDEPTEFPKIKIALSAFLEVHPEFNEREEKRLQINAERLLKEEEDAIRGKYAQMYKEYQENYHRYENPWDDEIGYTHEYLAKANQIAEQLRDFYEYHLKVLDPDEYQKRLEQQEAENRRLAAEQEARKREKEQRQREKEEFILEQQKQVEAQRKIHEENDRMRIENQSKEKKERNAIETKLGACKDFCVEAKRFRDSKNFNAAIGEYEKALPLIEALESNPKLSEKNRHEIAAFYCNLASAFNMQGNLREAIVNYDKALKNTDPDSVSDAKLHFEKMLARKTKKEIFEAIKRISDGELRSRLSETCKHPDSALGKRMWQPARFGLTNCSLESGTLAKIQQYIDGGCKEYKDIEKVQSSSLWSKLFPKKTEETREVEMTRPQVDKKGNKLE